MKQSAQQQVCNSENSQYAKYETVYIPTDFGILKQKLDIVGFVPRGKPLYIVVGAPDHIVFVQPYINSNDETDIIYRLSKVIVINNISSKKLSNEKVDWRLCA